MAKTVAMAPKALSQLTQEEHKPACLGKHVFELTRMRSEHLASD